MSEDWELQYEVAAAVLSCAFHPKEREPTFSFLMQIFGTCQMLLGVVLHLYAFGKGRLSDLVTKCLVQLYSEVSGLCTVNKNDFS